MQPITSAPRNLRKSLHPSTAGFLTSAVAIIRQVAFDITEPKKRRFCKALASTDRIFPLGIGVVGTAKIA
jgi:hypothetical protein